MAQADRLGIVVDRLLRGETEKLNDKNKNQHCIDHLQLS